MDFEKSPQVEKISPGKERLLPRNERSSTTGANSRII